MAELTQNPRETAKGVLDLIKTPWTLIVAILAAVAILDPGNLREVGDICSQSLGTYRAIHSVCSASAILPQGDRRRGDGGARLCGA